MSNLLLAYLAAVSVAALVAGIIFLLEEVYG